MSGELRGCEASGAPSWQTPAAMAPAAARSSETKLAVFRDTCLDEIVRTQLHFRTQVQQVDAGTVQLQQPGFALLHHLGKATECRSEEQGGCNASLRRHAVLSCAPAPYCCGAPALSQGTAHQCADHNSAKTNRATVVLSAAPWERTGPSARRTPSAASWRAASPAVCPSANASQTSFTAAAGPSTYGVIRHSWTCKS